MAAYVIGRIAIKDPRKWEAYREQVPATLAPWQAELVFRGKPFAVFSGTADHTDVVVIRFADATAVRDWFESPAYQALIPLRETAADVTLIGYET
jgi:uncharacterized protein (DUF1330 family)